jgi:hypothetical protein
MPLAERMGTLLTAVKQGNPPLSTWLRVADDHVLDGAEQSVPFTANGHYFVLRVHQAYLAAARQWFARYDPMLFALTEYTTYDGGRTREPFLVSPDTFRRDGHPAPAGMSFTDVRATGLRPYRGNTNDVTDSKRSNRSSGWLTPFHCLASGSVSTPWMASSRAGL